MWEFPNGRVEDDPAKGLVDTLKTEYGLKVQKKEILKSVRHAYSHFSVTVHPFICELMKKSKNRDFHWIKVTELEDYPMGWIDRQIARQIRSIILNI